MFHADRTAEREDLQEVQSGGSNEPGRQSGKKWAGEEGRGQITLCLINQGQCILSPMGQGKPLKHFFKQECDSVSLQNRELGFRWEAEVGIWVKKDDGLNSSARDGHVRERVS